MHLCPHLPGTLTENPELPRGNLISILWASVPGQPSIPHYSRQSALTAANTGLHLCSAGFLLILHMYYFVAYDHTIISLLKCTLVSFYCLFIY